MVPEYQSVLTVAITTSAYYCDFLCSRRILCLPELRFEVFRNIMHL